MADQFPTLDEILTSLRFWKERAIRAEAELSRFKRAAKQPSLTLHQVRLKSFIAKQIELTGVAPSYDEMRDYMGLRSKSGIFRLIAGLEERGHIRKLKHRARALEVIAA